MKITASSILGWLLLLLALTSAAGARAQQVAAPALEEAAAYGLLSGANLVAGTSAGQPSPIRVQGRAGAAAKISAGVQASAGVYDQGSGTVPDALKAAQEARTYCTKLGGTSLSRQFDGQTLAAGAYLINDDAGLGPGAYLTLTGDTATVIVLNVMGSLELGAQAQVVLDGVLPQHVFWNVAKSLAVASDVSFSGVALTGGSITLTGLHAGSCALLSQQGIVLTDLSAMIGSSRFFAAARPAGICLPSSSVTCAPYALPGSELIQDGSFEYYTCIPDDVGGLSYDPSVACFWQGATFGTADYFHEYATNPRVGVPYNTMGRTTTTPPMQQAVYAMGQNSTTQQGRAYGGIFVYTPLIYQGYPYREYIAQKNTGVLQAGHRYYGEFSVHLAPYSGYEVTNLGMAVVPTGYGGYPDVTLPSAPIVLTPAVSGTPNNSLLAGPLNDWHRIGKVFPQASTYNGFTVLLGNFEANPAHPATGNPASEASVGAYYFIDNVTLSMVTEAGDGYSIGAACGRSSATLGTLPMPTMTGATYAWTASPTDPSLTTSVANPTVSPGQTTTYTLTVTIPGQSETYTTSTTVTVKSPTYAQAAGATYVAPAGLAAYELGGAASPTYTEPGGCKTYTIIDASQPPYNGTVTFAGTYRVRGNVLLRNGTFNVLPGTVFYVDGYGHQYYDCERNAITVVNGTLNLTGATLQAGCDALWQGIMLYGNAALTTQASGSTRTLIRDAQVAVWRNPDQGTFPGVGVGQGNRYQLSGTDFLNNLFSLFDLGEGHLTSSTATTCTFKTDLSASPLTLESGHPAGVGFSLAIYQKPRTTDPAPVTISNCQFDRLHTGLYGFSADYLVQGCTFTNCWFAAANSGEYVTPVFDTNFTQPPTAPTYTPLQRMAFRGNTITLPASFPASYTAGQPYCYGLKTQCDFAIENGNAISRPAGSTVQNSRGISLVHNSDVTDNSLQNLVRGLEAASGDNVYGNHYTLSRNSFTDNAAGVVFTPSSFSADYGHTTTVPVDLTLRCNSFASAASGAYGVVVESNTRFTGTLGSASQPNGNRFDGLVGADASHRFSNLGLNPLNYYGYNNTSQELPTGPSRPNNVQVNASTVGTCGGSTGVNRPAGPSAGDDNQRAPAASPAAASASRLPDLQQAAYQQAYQQVLAHLRAPATRPGWPALPAADRQALRQVAASGSAAAYPACQLLQLYEPACACAATSPAPADRLAASAPAPGPASAGPALGEAHPNPASETVAFAYHLPGAVPATLVVRDLTGRLVLTQALPAPAGEVVLSVRGLAAGLYLATLEVAGRPLATRKLAVTH